VNVPARLAYAQRQGLAAMLRKAYTSDGFDLVKERGRLAIDDGLETAVALSLFTDAPATDDELAAAGLSREQNRGAWWGNDFVEIPGDVWGSKLWLLQRAKRTDETLARAQDYATQAVRWLIVDGLATRIPISAQWLGTSGFLIIGAQMFRPGDLQPQWRRLWNAQTGELLESG
jgi:phage gp46-like protein